MEGNCSDEDEEALMEDIRGEVPDARVKVEDVESRLTELDTTIQ